MIPKFDNFKAKKSNNNAREILPAGGYVCKILKAELEEYSWGQKLVLSFDITEGEHKDHFRADYANQSEDSKRWRGVWRLNLPSGDGSQQDTWKQNAVNNLAAVLEESNPGYTWDWDETHLKNKAIGVLFREFEWELNGNSGISTEAYSCTDLDSVRCGKYRIAKRRPLRQRIETAVAVPQPAAADEDDLPF